MASNYISPISMDALSNLCQELGKNNYINAHDFERYQVKRGLRNSDGTGVLVGVTKVGSVQGYLLQDLIFFARTDISPRCVRKISPSTPTISPMSYFLKRLYSASSISSLRA